MKAAKKVVSESKVKVENNKVIEGESIRMIDVETGEVMISSFCCDKGFNGSSMVVEVAESIKRKVSPDKEINQNKKNNR